MSKLYFCTYHGSTEGQDHYVCSNYKSNTGSCSIHYIREKVLSALVLAHLQATISYIQGNEDEFVRLVMDKDAQEQRRELERGQEQAVNVDQFVALVRKYTEVRELTPTIVNEFIKMVIVHAPTKINGHRAQFVQVVYNLVGEVTIPETLDGKTA